MISKIKTLLFCICIVASNTTKAQNITYTEALEHKGDIALNTTIGHFQDKLLFYRDNVKEHTLEFYDNQLKHTATVILDFLSKDALYTKFIPLDTTILTLFEEVNGTKHTLYAAILDPTGRLKGNIKTLGQSREHFLGNNKSQFFGSSISKDKQHIFIYEINNKSKAIDGIGFWLYAKDLSTSKKIKFNYQSGTLLEYSTPLISNSGVAYIPLYASNESSSKGNDYALISIDQVSNKANTHKLISKQDVFLEKPISKINLTEDKITVATLYSNKRKGNAIGIATFHWSMADQNFSSLDTYTFEEDMTKGIKKRKKDKAFNNYELGNIIFYPNGAFQVVAEETYVSRVRMASGFVAGGAWGMGFPIGGMTPYDMYYQNNFHYNDILIFNYGEHLKCNGYRFIEKEQNTLNDNGNYSSYCSIATDTSLRILYNNFMRNTPPLNMVIISLDGAIQSTAFASPNILNEGCLPKVAKQIAPNELILPVVSRNKVRFVRFQF